MVHQSAWQFLDARPAGHATASMVQRLQWLRHLNMDHITLDDVLWPNNPQDTVHANEQQDLEFFISDTEHDHSDQ